MTNSQTNSEITATLADRLYKQLHYWLDRNFSLAEAIEEVETRTCAGVKPWSVALGKISDEEKYNA